jgi:predicted nucleic-acid-binding Zn-ribbon protein
LPDWVCPKCGASDAEDIIDRWPPVYGPIATECRQCDYGELEPGVTYAHAA